MKLYLIHGWTYTTEPWRQTLQLLKQQHIDVEMLNVPGLTTKSQKVWTIADYVRWVDHSIPDGAIALGHSNGGRILLNLLSQNPQKLQHVILLDAAGIYEPSKKREIARSLAKIAAPLKKIKLCRRLVHKLLRAHDYAKAPANMQATLANMLDSDKKLDFSSITTPTTILWGGADTVTPLRQAKMMQQKLQNSSLKIYPNWTHAPYISDPVGLARAIIAALKEIA